MANEPANQIIRADGTTEEFLPADGEHFTLEEMQAAVGGYIERLYLSDSRYLLVDEDGRSKGLAPNVKASLLYSVRLFGTVLVCEAKYFDDPEEEDEPE